MNLKKKDFDHNGFEPSPSNNDLVALPYVRVAIPDSFKD